MIRFTNVLDTKEEIEDEKGNKILDLTKTTLKDCDFEFTESFKISSEYEMRPDLLASVMFGNYEKFGEFMKANRISNPFSGFVSGDIVLMPDTFSTDKHFKRLSSNEKSLKEQILQQYIDPSKQTDTDSIKSKITQFKNREKLGLPPNILDEGEEEISIRSGKIVYGPNVSTPKKERDKEKEEYLKKLANGK